MRATTGVPVGSGRGRANQTCGAGRTMMPDTAPRPVLHLSGSKLRACFAALVRAAEPAGGIERMVEAVRSKSELFRDRLGAGRAATIERTSFVELIRFMPTARRRIGPLIEMRGWPDVRGTIAMLLHGAQAPGTADARLKSFERAIRGQIHASGAAATSPPRFLRDLAAELLHNVWPEHYPLMTRWIWDAAANTGVLREIWHDPASGSDVVDHLVIDVPDTHETFLVLREELSQFLAGQGVFRDMLWYVDLVAAQVYANYIAVQGGALLKTDFNAATDPLEHVLRMLGLDGRCWSD